jgi:prepilin peptidase CpaA
VFAGPAHGVIAGVAFVLLLTAGCVADVRTRRIPNRLVLWMAVLGVLASVAAEPWLGGLASAAAGLSLGLALWFPFYLLHWIGAGDVKFFAAASAWLGAGPALYAAVLAALFGGLLSLAWLVWTHGWWVTLVYLRHGLYHRAASDDCAVDTRASRRVPYGVAMAAGLLTAAWLPQLLR